MPKGPLRSGLLLVAALAAACGAPEPPEKPPLMVFAAASLRDVVVDLGAEFERQREVEVVYNFAGSNTLAQQILAAPRADVFLSADTEWVDVLERAGRIVPGTRGNILSNRLVVIAHRDADLRVGEVTDLARLDFRFLALADPEAVPAGRYARAALQRIPWDGGDLWQAVAGRVAPALDVRAALALVEADPQILGIVYKTDALAAPGVRVLHELAPLPDAPITYCATLVAGGDQPELGRAFLDFLDSSRAQALAHRYGFVTGGP